MFFFLTREQNALPDSTMSGKNAARAGQARSPRGPPNRLSGGAGHKKDHNTGVPTVLLPFVYADAAANSASNARVGGGSGNSGALQGLPLAKARVDECAADGSTPVQLAFRWGRASALRLLLNAKADAEAPDRFGWSPVRHAMKNENVDALQAPLQAKAIKNALAASPRVTLAGSVCEDWGKLTEKKTRNTRTQTQARTQSRLRVAWSRDVSAPPTAGFLPACFLS